MNTGHTSPPRLPLHQPRREFFCLMTIRDQNSAHSVLLNRKDVASLGPCRSAHGPRPLAACEPTPDDPVADDPHSRARPHDQFMT
jgi:hypothetical protein